ncbi:hypothetical protein L204_104739 [Cryptococcus depauperatus]|nr:hypothetical protein L204_03612 [Cryptococcus depauperatus CBS 7855]
MVNNPPPIPSKTRQIQPVHREAARSTTIQSSTATAEQHREDDSKPFTLTVIITPIDATQDTHPKHRHPASPTRHTVYPPTLENRTTLGLSQQLERRERAPCTKHVAAPHHPSLTTATAFASEFPCVVPFRHGGSRMKGREQA